MKTNQILGFLCTFWVHIQLTCQPIRAKWIWIEKYWIEACFRNISYKSKSNPISIISQDSCQFYWPNSVYYKCITIADQRHKGCSREKAKSKLKNLDKKWGSVFSLEDLSEQFKASHHILGLHWSHPNHL